MIISQPWLFKSKGRMYITIEENGKRYSLPYAKFILQQKLGRKLIGNETADHEDNNKLNDAPDNIQLLNRGKNTQKYIEDKFGGLYLKVKCVCKACEKEFERLASQERTRIKKRMDGPFCSKSCAMAIHGTYNALAIRRRKEAR